MADIRYKPLILDDFNRADEPYPPGLLPPWYWTPGWDLPSALENNGIGSPDWNPNNQAQSTWTGGTMSGDEMESWGIASGDQPLHDGYYFGMHTASGNGYYIRNAHSVGAAPWEIWKKPGGKIASGTDFMITGYAPDYCLLQVSGSNLSGWLSQDAGATWVLMVGPVADTSYREGLMPSFGGQGGGPGWQAMGGGPFDRKSQIYRRLHTMP